ncbi:MAG: SDR family NAD(P)-dependent oxidoreductase [Gammaproteobacteria bacterium]|nr:SDR family NAD(P)-dependent oxidoreductase [Gammaproteobacteria bacterium]
MSSKNVALVLGVGPLNGLGAAIAKRFVQGGSHVVIAGRTREQLEDVAAALRTDGEVTAVVADATDESSVSGLFEHTASLGGNFDAAIYNAGNNRPGNIRDMDASYFEAAWRVGCFGGFLFGREAVRRMLPGPGGDSRRTLLFTGASASLRGRSGFGAFNSAKAGLRTLAQAMSKEYGPEGLHVGHVVVDGGIAGDKIIQNVPQLVEQRGMDGLIDLGGLAEAYWFLHQQNPQSWSFEIDMRTYKENW